MKSNNPEDYNYYYDKRQCLACISIQKRQKIMHLREIPHQHLSFNKFHRLPAYVTQSSGDARESNYRRRPNNFGPRRSSTAAAAAAATADFEQMVTAELAERERESDCSSGFRVYYYYKASHSLVGIFHTQQEPTSHQRAEKSSLERSARVRYTQSHAFLRAPPFTTVQFITGGKSPTVNLRARA